MITRVLIADDQPKVRFALRVILENRPETLIVGEVEDAKALLSDIVDAAPTVVILDWMLPGLSDIGSIKALRSIMPDVYVIALSGRPELGQEALQGGADAFVSKIDSPERLMALLDQIRSEVAEETSS